MGRAAIIGGKRTAFVRAFGKFAGKSALDLAKFAAEEAVKSSALDPADLEELIFSAVLLNPRTPNAARELVLRSDVFPDSLGAHFISNNCISGLVAINMLKEAIEVGRVRSGLAGGTESMSQPALTLHPGAEKFFLKLSRAKTLGQRLSMLASYKLKYMLPLPPSPKEPSTGKTMGQHCEMMVKDFEIAREPQDALAYASHQNAAAARERGFFAKDIAALDGVDTDNIIRPETSLEKLASLKPVFDRSGAGSLTAGNSSPLTDGASAVILADEGRAKELGAEPLGFIEKTVYSSVDPNDGLLMAPGLAVPALLEQTGLSVSDIDLFEIHEAFAAQVLANMKVWKEGWDKYPQLKPIGEIPSEKINVNGGSIAIGHPFAATGGRLILATLHALREKGLKRGVISVCAAGAMGCAMLVSTE